MSDSKIKHKKRFVKFQNRNKVARSLSAKFYNFFMAIENEIDEKIAKEFVNTLTEAENEFIDFLFKTGLISVEE